MSGKNSGIIDNDSVIFENEFKKKCLHADTLKIAAGYFYVNGFDLVKDELKSLSNIQIIMGRETDETTAEQIKFGYELKDRYKMLNEINKIEENKKLNENYTHNFKLEIKRRMLNELDAFDENNDNEIIALKELSDFIKNDKIMVRIYPNNKFHAKAYIFESNDEGISDVAIVGSSNFSRAGMLKSGNIELNSVHKNDSEVNVLKDWYKKIWDSSENFKPDMLNIIKKSIPYIHKITNDDQYVTPVELFKIMAYEFLNQEIEIPDEILAEFQKIGVINAKKKLNDFNGCIISDSVGLGKTFIGLELIQEYQRRDKNVLLIVPKSVKQNWQREMTRNISNGSSFKIILDEPRLKIITISELSRYDLKNNSDRKKLDVIKKEYNLILIDEAHRFRNKGMFNDGEYSQNKNYANLNYIRNIDMQYVLLTATPLNNSIKDLENLLMIFLNPIILKNKNSSLDMINFKKYYENTHELKKEKCNPTPNKIKIHELVNKLKENQKGIVKILEEVMILRTRTDISKKYPNLIINEKQVSFTLPKINPVRYESTDEYVSMYDDVKILLDGLNVPHISMINKNSGQTLSGLYRILLFKRLESSIYSFVISLERLKEKEITLLDEIQKYGWDTIRKQRQKEHNKSAIEDDDELADWIEEYTIEADNDQNMQEDIELMIKNDLQQIDNFFNIHIDRIRSDDATYDYHDPKINKLKEILESNQGKKILIFSQYVDTVDYLYRNLKSFISSKDQIIDCVIGSNESTPLGTDHSTDKKINLFAPKTNEYEIKSEDVPIDILIATDSLSEGVNLQDSSIVVNYDLPWNPMKIVQRVGRVDRIGSTEQTNVFNILPDERLDVFLTLLEKLKSKIENVVNIIGKESYILSEDEEINPRIIGEKIARIKEAGDFSIYEEFGRNKILRDIQTDEEETANILELKSLIKRLGFKIDDFKNYEKTMYSIIKCDDMKGVFAMYEIHDQELNDKIKNITIYYDFITKKFREIEISEPKLHESEVRILKDDISARPYNLPESLNKIEKYFLQNHYDKEKERFKKSKMISELSTSTIQNTIILKLEEIQKIGLNSIDDSYNMDDIDKLSEIFNSTPIVDQDIDHLKKLYSKEIRLRSDETIRIINKQKNAEFIATMYDFYDQSIKNNPNYTLPRNVENIYYKMICWGASI